MKHRVVGIENKVYDFKDKSGRAVYSVGLLFHLSPPLPARRNEIGVSQVYLNSKKLENSYIPEVGDDVVAQYDRFGKVFRFNKV